MPLTRYPDQKSMPRSRVSKRKPIVIGHRGAAGIAPENTLVAFRKAAELGADGVEFDVQRTADGELVIFHDENLKRTTNISGVLRQVTWADLQAADSGSWFAKDFEGERVPKMRTLFEFMRTNDLLMFIELKDPFRYPGIEEQIAELIHEYNFVERAQVRSFYHDALHNFQRIAPDIAISELWYDHLPSEEETNFKTINALFSLYTQEAIAEIHERGQKATAWTVNDMNTAAQLISWGIDGLTTDYPDRLLGILK